jgi:dihydroorotate dehydrogenase
MDYLSVPDFYPLMKRILWRFDAEHAHGLALKGLCAAPGWCLPSPGSDAGLTSVMWGRSFVNPIGLAAGFDKHADAVPNLFRLGFGFVEIGGVTLHPQPGNPKPRLFRLAEDHAIINRMGLNSVGANVVAGSLARHRRKSLPGPVAVNLGLNKEASDPAADYAALASKLAPLAEILTINVSSPNTAGLRALQNPDKLIRIVEGVRKAAATAAGTLNPAILVKIAPDLAAGDVADICALAIREGFDGLVVSNTTTARPETLQSTARAEQGGLSGRPLFVASTALLKDVYARTEGRIPLVGVGGVSSAADAYAKIRAGASLVQLYSSLVFEGPALVGKIKTGLADLLEADGFASPTDAVGADHRAGASV